MNPAVVMGHRRGRDTGRSRIVAAALAGLFALVLAGPVGCAEEALDRYRIGSAVYAFPATDIRTVRDSPSGFIRVQPADTPFELVFDAETADQVDRRGFPVIFSVSDVPGEDVEPVRTGDRIVLCRRASQPNGGCGATLEAHGAIWSVLLPPARLNEADHLLARARNQLESYRVG